MSEIVHAFKALKPYGMAQGWAELAAEGIERLTDCEWLIRQLPAAETADRAIRSVPYRMKAAKFPVHRDLAGFGFAAAQVDRTPIEQLSDLRFTETARNLVLVGGTGTGKSHLATALGVKAITEYGKRVRFFSTADPANALELEKTAGKHGRMAYSLLHSATRRSPKRAGPCCFTRCPNSTSGPASSSPPLSALPNGRVCLAMPR
jgi:DNA replication protein DnaC